MSTTAPVPNFPAGLNQGSLRRWVEKSAPGLINRFGTQITAELDSRRWGGDYEQLEALVQELLLATVPAFAAVLYNSYGYEVPDQDQASYTEVSGDVQ